jgi:hypothetical protein
MQNKTSENTITHVGVIPSAFLSMKTDAATQNEYVFHGHNKHAVASGCTIVLSRIWTNKLHRTRRLRLPPPTGTSLTVMLAQNTIILHSMCKQDKPATRGNTAVKLRSATSEQPRHSV